MGSEGPNSAAPTALSAVHVFGFGPCMASRTISIARLSRTSHSSRSFSIDATNAVGVVKTGAEFITLYPDCKQSRLFMTCGSFGASWASFDSGRAGGRSADGSRIMSMRPSATKAWIRSLLWRPRLWKLSLRRLPEPFPWPGLHRPSVVSVRFQKSEALSPLPSFPCPHSPPSSAEARHAVFRAEVNNL
jgi:hypothetical protein